MAGRSFLIAAVVAVTAVLVSSPLSASASIPPPPSHDPFYSYSRSLAHTPPGAVLKKRSVTISELGHGLPYSATQFLYRTTGELGKHTATVATVIRPLQPPIATKIVSYQTAYDGLGSICDPSYTLRGGDPSYSTATDEEQVIAGFVSLGYTVVVSDYEGTNLDWGAGQESGYGTLDAIRAAETLLKLSAATTPVGLNGYSGGSIATDFATELAPRYAPTLDIVGAAEGGVPVDYAHNLAYINGSKDWSGVIPAVLVGIGRAFHIDIGRYESAYGKRIARQVNDQCINNFLGAYPGLTIQKLVKHRYRNFLGVPQIARITNHLTMARTGTPRGPLFIGVGNQDGTGDGVMIAADVEALAHTYCARGVSVQFNVYKGDDHTNAAIAFEPGAFQFLEQRLNGASVPNGCSSIGRGNSLAPLPVGHAKSGALRLRYLGPSRRRHGLVIRLSARHGRLRGLVVRLRRGQHVLAKLTLKRLTTRHRTLVLRIDGRLPPPGRYRLTVNRGHATLAERTLRIR